MARLPQISGKRLVRVAESIGWTFHHQKGSHVVMKHPSRPDVRLVVPQHKVLKKGTLSHILKDLGLTGDALREKL
jgi:predicted RNA binding protein YcfA (HicA-like mRNA interferase family)